MKTGLIVWLVSILSIHAAPLRVFLLAGQSNMSGRASVEHLLRLVQGLDKNDPSEYSALWNGTQFVEIPNVYIQFGRRKGPLTVGYGTALSNFGPELGIGQVLSEQLHEPCALIKSAYGGKSLAVPFRPPSAGIANYTKNINKYGVYYRKMMADFRTGLSQLDELVPNYDTRQGYILSGLVWFHGTNDLGSDSKLHEYSSNLVHLIHDVRRDLQFPSLPIVIGELGMHGLYPSADVVAERVKFMRETQYNVTQRADFRSNTLFVPTARYAVLNGTSYNELFHYRGRADTMIRMGQALGRALLELMPSLEDEDVIPEPSLPWCIPLLILLALWLYLYHKRRRAK